MSKKKHKYNDPVTVEGITYHFKKWPKNSPFKIKKQPIPGDSATITSHPSNSTDMTKMNIPGYEFSHTEIRSDGDVFIYKPL